jgi:hypothetical protein
MKEAARYYAGAAFWADGAFNQAGAGYARY